MVIAPMPTGSGALVVHRHLERLLPNYRVVAYSPAREFVPPLVGLQKLAGARMIHTAPDHAVFLARRNTPLVITFHNFVIDAFMRPYSTFPQRLHYSTDLRWSIGRALRRAEAVTAVSQFVADLVKSELDYKGEIAVIPNGVDTSLFRPAGNGHERERVSILFAGNLTLRKGACALGYIVDRLPDADFVCASGLRGTFSSTLAARANVRILRHAVHEDMPDTYRAADIFLLPSVREGMSLALLEAMASGLPVVATDGASNVELVHSGYGGYLCPLGDIDAFASALRRLMESPERRAQMGAYNRRLIESRYGLAPMASAYAALFERVAAR